MSTRVDHLRAAAARSAPARCGRRPRRPGRCTASTPHSATFSAWRLAPIDGHHDDAGVLELARSRSCFGAWAKDATFTPSRMSRSTRSSTSAWSARRLTPNGLSVRSLTSRDRACAARRASWWPTARMPSAAGVRRGRRRAAGRRPSPCRSARSGTRRRTGRRARVCSGRGRSPGTRSPHLGAAQAVGVEHLADQAQLLVGGQPRLVGTSSGDDAARSRWPRRPRRRVTPGCTERSRMRVVGRLEVEDAEVGDDPADLVEPRRRPERRRPGRSRRRRRCRPARRTRVASGSGSSSVVGWLMVLPGAPRKPSSCALGCCQSPMRAMFWLPYRSIWVAPIITWRWPYHDHVEHRAVRDPALDDLRRRGRADRQRVGRRTAPRRR